MPAAVQRLRMSPSCQRFTLRCVWRTISIMLSHGFVEHSVLASWPVIPSRISVSVSGRPSRSEPAASGQVLALLENPELIKAEIERRLATLRAEHPASHRREGLQRDLTRAQNALRRLIDGYQEQLITLEELRARTPELRKREATLRAELDALDTDLHNAET